MTIDVKDYVYGTTDLIGVIEPLRGQQAPNFLLSILFPNTDTQETEKIHLDKVAEDLRIAAFVAPSHQGKAREKEGYFTDAFSPAYIKELDQLFPSDMTRRLPGEPIGAPYSAERRANGKIAMTIDNHQKRVDRRLEVMAADFAMNGSLTIVGEDYPERLVDYGRSSSFRKTLLTSARWGETDVSPTDNLDDWLGEYAETNGSAATDVIFTQDSWKLFKADTKLDRILDRQLGQDPAVSLGFTATTPGRPQYKGSIDGVNLWVYNDTYKDMAGAVQKLLPAYTVLVTSRVVVDGWQAFGLVQDFGALTAMEIFSKTWANENPSALNVLSQTAPLLVPSRADGVMAVTVR